MFLASRGVYWRDKDVTQSKPNHGAKNRETPPAMRKCDALASTGAADDEPTEEVAFFYNRIAFGF